MRDQTTQAPAKASDDQTPAAPAADSTGDSQRQTLTDAAMAVVRRLAGSSPAGAADSKESLIARAGQGVGLGLGILVTEALRAVPSWNTPVVDAQGKPVESVAGADRIGDHDIEKRHEEVVGPKIAELVQKIPAGAIHNFLAGVGAGATQAPGESYRLESELSDMLHGKGGA